MLRKYFKSNDLTLSYLDFEGKSDRILICLHGHFGNARMFANFATRIDGWRVFSLDQRGHGWSDHPTNLNYTRDSYINDLYNFITAELGAESVVILGHSLGGVNAYQFAARYPELVEGLIIEDIGAEVNDDASFANHLPKYTNTLKDLKKAVKHVGINGFDYFAESAYECEHGWAFRFDAPGMVISQQMLNGTWWEDWEASTCPTLLLHGLESWFVKKDQIEKMASKRPNTYVKMFENCSHEIHDDDPEGFYETVSDFLYSLK